MRRGALRWLVAALLPALCRAQVGGVVVTEDGRPVAGANVEVLVEHQAQPAISLALVTDAQGRFAADLLKMLPAASYRIRARAGRMATVASVAAQPGQPVSVRLIDRQTASLVVTVQDTAQRPLPGATVVMLATDPEFGTALASMITDGRGEATFSGIWPLNTLDVSVTAGGYGRGERLGVHVEPGQQRRLTPLVLRRADAAIEGWVLDEVDRPVAGAQVIISDPLVGRRETQTDRDGWFRLEQLVRGEYVLRVTGRDGRLIGRFDASTARQYEVVRLLRPRN